MREAFGMKDRLVFMDVVVDPSENVYPMIEAGKGHHEMYLPRNCPPNRSSPDMRHIISILLENEAGALSRVAGLFSARGFNIESLTVARPRTPPCRA